MTIIVCTVTTSAKKGWLTTDSAVTRKTLAEARAHAAALGPSTGRLARDPEDAMAATFRGDGRPGPRRPADFHVRKQLVVQRLRLAAAGNGSSLAVLATFGLLASQPWRDVEDALEALPFHLRLIRDVGGDDHVMDFLYVVAWVPSRERVVGHVFCREDGFAATELGPGTSMTPAPHPGDPVFAQVRALYAPAREGREVPRLHGTIALCVARSGSMGCYAGASARGGDLHHAEVSRGGVRSSVLGHLSQAEPD